MKLKHVIFPAMAGLVIGQASVQGQTYVDKPPLVIDTAGDYYEEYVNRIFTQEGDNDFAIEMDHVDASYTGHNINIDVTCADYSGSHRIVSSSDSKYINLSADEGTWSIINLTNARDFTGVYLSGLSETSTISNTKINIAGAGTGIEIYNTELVLDNVEIDSQSDGINNEENVGIIVGAGGVVTNVGQRQVSVTADISNLGSTVLGTYAGGTIDLHDATITAVGENALTAVLESMDVNGDGGASTISLTNSSISSANGNNLIVGAGGALTANLNKVNLENAKNQQIFVPASLVGMDSYVTVNLSSGTAFDGYVTAISTRGIVGEATINISSGASWNVTQNSVLGDLAEGLGSLSLDGSSKISFEELSEGTFTNITSAAIALEAGAILMLGVDAATIEGWIEGNDGTYSTQLFVTETVFSNDGVVLMSSDGLAFEYTTDDLGTYTLTRVLPPSIPEPTTATFGLAALSLLALRRNKK